MGEGSRHVIKDDLLLYNGGILILFLTNLRIGINLCVSFISWQHQYKPQPVHPSGLPGADYQPTLHPRKGLMGQACHQQERESWANLIYTYIYTVIHCLFVCTTTSREFCRFLIRRDIFAKIFANTPANSGSPCPARTAQQLLGWRKLAKPSNKTQR